MLRHYRQIGIHNVFGYNSGKFDLPVLIPYIVNYATRKNVPIKALKRGNSYIIIKIDNCTFKGLFNFFIDKQSLDSINFNSKVSLDRYLKQWGASVNKMIFPYERYNSIEQMRQEADFPPYAAFYSTLRKSNVNRDDYDAALREYNRRKALPDDSKEKYHNMADYLRVSFVYSFVYKNIFSDLQFM